MMKCRASGIPWIFVLTLIASFCALAAWSEYSLVPSEKINSDIALMLTPYGIAQNLLFSENSLLHRFYFIPTVRVGMLDRPVVALLVVMIVSQAVGLLFVFRKKRAV